MSTGHAVTFLTGRNCDFSNGDRHELGRVPGSAALRRGRSEAASGGRKHPPLPFKAVFLPSSLPGPGNRGREAAGRPIRGPSRSAFPAERLS